MLPLFSAFALFLSALGLPGFAFESFDANLFPQPPATAAPNPSPAPPPAGMALPARGTYRITGDANTLSVFAVSVDASELFTAIASKAGLPIVVDGEVSRKITINLLNRPAKSALTDICAAYGLSIADVDGITMISGGIPTSPSSYLLSEIISIPTKYVIAASARNLLPVFLQDYVKVNAEQNAVVLSAPLGILAKFGEDIAQFDIPASQILVELLLVELTDTSLDEFQLPVRYLNAGQGPTTDPSNGTVVYNGFSTQDRQFQATLTALISKGKARVRANPRIATVSGRPASFFVGIQRYVSTPIESPTGSKNNIDAGVRLLVTPYTGGQGQVLIDVNAEVSTLSAPDPITKLPEKSTRTATTIVRINDGKTIIIGGLNQQENRSVRTKIPVIGDIPFLGPLLFQGHTQTATNTELVIFITPRILSRTGHLPDAEEKALIDRFLKSDLTKPLPATPEPAAPKEKP